MVAEKIPPGKKETKRPLLNLAGGNKAGLEKVFGRLVGQKIRPPEAGLFKLICRTLEDLGFQADGAEGLTFSHPFSPGRAEAFSPGGLAAGQSGEKLALDFASRAFPEMEFYLPFIQAKARISEKNKGPRNSPEPEYDEDGFLLE